MIEQIINGIKYRLDEENLTAEVTKKSGGYEGDIIIPETVVFNEASYLVTSIGENAFFCCESLKSITIPNSVAHIGDDAFGDCSSLTSIVIPDSVTSIGESVFDDCSSLTAIKVAEGNTVFDSREKCNALIHTATNTLIRGCQNTNIPNSVTSIQSDAFYGCSSLTSITIPNSVTNIGDGVFSGCSSLTSIVVAEDNMVYDSREECNAIIETATNTLIYGCQSTTIPNTVTSIGDEAFYRCESLAAITIPNSIQSIGHKAFSICKSLKSIIIPDSVTSIRQHAFEYCESLKSVAIGNSVRSIEFNTFCRCSLLTEVTIGNNLRSIGDYAFEDCKSLTSITIPDSLTDIGKEAFYCCKSLRAIHYSGTIAQWKTITLAKGLIGAWNRRSAINVVYCTDGNMWVH